MEDSSNEVKNGKLSYLQLSTDEEIDEEFLAPEDFKILGEALGRVEIVKVAGEYQLKQSTATEINVAPNIFNWLLKSVKNNNWLKKKYEYEKQTTRSAADDSTASNGYDCVPYCIEYMITTFFGDSIDLNDVRDDMIYLYGEGGVPSDKYGEFLDRYFKGSYVSKSQWSENYFSTADDAMCGVLWGNHSVVIIGRTGDNVAYYDPQNGVSGVTSVDDFSLLYRATDTW